VSDRSTSPSATRELGQFLRARRERTAPRDVGLPDSGRRRTPGLRREEVATLAGISVDYLIRLEQGRDLHPSAEILAALADAMRMTDDERDHLYLLGVRSGNEALCPSAPNVLDGVAPTVMAVLEALDPTPAFIVTPASDVLAWNTAWATVVRALGFLDPAAGSVPNLARFVFTHAAARRVFPEWRAVADEQVGQLRQAHARWAHAPGLAEIVEELLAEPEFARRWQAHPVSAKAPGMKRLDHPEVGDLAVAYEVLELTGHAGQRLISWLPADDATAAALSVLTGGPRLRLVEPG